MRLIHLSDLHIRAEHNERVEACLASVPADAHVIITGDVVNDGAEIQLAQARALLEPLTGTRRTLAVLPGNHDMGALGLGYSEKAALAFDQDLSRHLGGGRYVAKVPVVRLIEDQSARVQIVALNSCAETVSPHDLACGEIGAPQLAALDDLLCCEFDGVRVVALHHHPFDRGFGMALKDSDALWRTIRGRCDVLMFGHKHVSESWEHRGGIPLVLASDSTPQSGRARLLTVTGRRVSVEDVCLAPRAA